MLFYSGSYTERPHNYTMNTISGPYRQSRTKFRPNLSGICSSKERLKLSSKYPEMLPKLPAYMVIQYPSLFPSPNKRPIPTSTSAFRLQKRINRVSKNHSPKVYRRTSTKIGVKSSPKTQKTTKSSLLNDYSGVSGMVILGCFFKKTERKGWTC
jgi:hypothetical protein